MDSFKAFLLSLVSGGSFIIGTAIIQIGGALAFLGGFIVYFIGFEVMRKYKRTD